MRSERRHRIIVGALLASTAAHAETQAVHVEYAAPAGCGSREQFLAELTQRTPRLRLLEPAEPGATIVVELADRSTGVHGELHLREVDGAETVRAVAGQSCEEVVPALALIASVLVAPGPSPRTDAPSPARTAPTPTAVAPARPASPPRLAFRFSIATGAAVSNAVAPSLSYAPWLELGVESERDGKRWPALSVALERYASSTTTTAAGSADFSTLLGRIAVYPWRYPYDGAWFLAPFAAFEAGALRANVSNTVEPHEPTVLWAAVDPGVRFEVRPRRALGISLDLLGIFPVVRDSFHFAPDFPVFSIPVFGWSGRLGVRGVWP